MVRQVGELLLPGLAEFLLLVRRVGLAAPEDGALVVLRELVLRAEDCVGGETRRRRRRAVISKKRPPPASDDGDES